jgi:hypothetical protein
VADLGTVTHYPCVGASLGEFTDLMQERLRYNSPDRNNIKIRAYGKKASDPARRLLAGAERMGLFGPGPQQWFQQVDAAHRIVYLVCSLSWHRRHVRT